jgi:hypothetical protein
MDQRRRNERGEHPVELTGDRRQGFGPAEPPKKPLLRSRIPIMVSRTLQAAAFAPLQGLYLVGLLGLLASLAVLRALGPFRPHPDRAR